MAAPQKTPVELGREVQASAMKSLRSSAPKIGINVVIAVLIWLIGNYVFIPISNGLFIQSFAVTQLISVTILIALIIIVFSILVEVRDVTDAIAGLVAYNAGGRTGEVNQEEFNSYKIAFRGFMYVLVVAAVFLLFGLQLNLINPALAAIVLLGITIWAVVMLWRSGRALSKTAERYANEWASRMESTGGR